MGLAALIALASVAVPEGHSLDAATEVWRTGSFQTITGSFRAVTGPFPVLPEDDEESYGIRQRAGVDALLSMATPVAPDGTLDERHIQEANPAAGSNRYGARPRP